MYFADATKGGLSWTPTSSSKAYPTLYWTVNPNDKTSPDGYQIEIYTVDGKKKITTDIKQEYFNSISIKQQADKEQGIQGKNQSVHKE